MPRVPAHTHVARALALALVLALIPLAACQWKLADPGDAAPTSAPMTDPWQPDATSIRFLPATSIAAGPNPRLNAEVEFTDDMGDPTKAVGTLHLAIHRDDPEPNWQGPTVRQWTYPLITLEDQQANYDRISRAYRFTESFDIAPNARSARWRLTARFTTPDGRRLTATWPDR